MAIKKTEKHVSKKGGKGGYTYSVNLKSPSKIPATKQEARREAKNTVVQIGHARPTDQIMNIRVSKKTEAALRRMADGNGVLHLTEEDMMTAVRGYIKPKSEKIVIDQEASIDKCIVKSDMTCKASFGEPTVLDIAKDIIYSDREQAYGEPRFNLDTIAQLWSVYLQRRFTNSEDAMELRAEDVAQLMILLKTARLIHHPNHKDSLVDQAGYAALQGRINGL